MVNEILVDGRVGREPEDYPAKEGKLRFIRFDIAYQVRGRKEPAWIPINAYGPVADKIVDGLALEPGDKVRVEGFLGCRHATPGCGRSHRFLVVVAKDCILLMPSRRRQGPLTIDYKWPPLLAPQDDDLPNL